MHERHCRPDWFLDKVRKVKMTEKTKDVVTKAFKDIQVEGEYPPYLGQLRDSLNLGEVEGKVETSPLRKQTESALDTQVGGDHYIKHTIQPWDIIDEYDLGYYGGNALKYLLRDKGDRKEDLEKARHYIAKMIGDLRE